MSITNSTLERRTPMPKGERRGFNSTLTPGKPPKARKRSKRSAKLRDPAYCAWIRTFTCPFGWDRLRFDPPESMLGWMLFHRDCSGPTECAHVRSRGAGGADHGNTIPLCRAHHREQHTKGMKSFQKLYGFDLKGLARKLEAKYVLRDFTSGGSRGAVPLAVRALPTDTETA